MVNIQALQEEFEILREEQPLLGDYSILSEIVEGEELSREEVDALFSEIQLEGIYKSDREELVNDIYLHSRGY